MKKVFFIINFLALSLVVFSKTPALSIAKEAPKGGFAHHFGEFHITPSADYFFFVQGKENQVNEPYEFKLPFIGFDMGVEYGYRPVEVFGVSAGLGFRMQGNYYRQTAYTLLGEKYVNLRSSGHTGFLQLPIAFHLYKQMSNSTFEFATGPQFNFPVFQTNMWTTFNSDGEKVTSDKDKDKFTTKYMGENASLGWNILLGAELELADHADMFIGPQINFLNIAYFKKDFNESRRDYGGQFDCSLGIKLGFRFHCEE